MARKTTISREGLEFLIGAVKNTINIGDIINNEDLADNKTYSNIKIEERIDDKIDEKLADFTGGGAVDLTDIENRLDTLETKDTTIENRVTINETNITGLQEQIDNLDIPEDVRKVFCDLNELNNAKGTNISLVVGEDNTEKIMNALEPNEEFINWFNNENAYNRFGIDSSMGNRLNSISIQKYHGNNGIVVAITNKGKILSRYLRANVLSGWDYDATDLTNINTKLTQLENKANFIPVVADNPSNLDLNNYIENGNYSIGDSSKYSNAPISQPGLLTVIRSNAYRLQIYAVVTNDNVYFRKSSDWGSTWSSWVLLNGEVDLTAINSKLTQLENTINEVGGGGIYQSGEVEVGTWTGGQKLYRHTISDNTQQSISDSGVLRVDFFTLSRDKYTVVKLDGTFRMCAASDNSGAHTVYTLPYIDLETNRQVHLVYTTMDKVRLSGVNLTNYKILGFDVSIYYYKK